jgi:hypothetical protein
MSLHDKIAPRIFDRHWVVGVCDVKNDKADIPVIGVIGELIKELDSLARSCRESSLGLPLA